ncbi:MAG: amino acid adenylation domain-containing protein, partial [Woeseiaceae bacterium]|nr:amino acid adenylation domain-containing protein [Woeseiaceae bacterium]
AAIPLELVVCDGDPWEEARRYCRGPFKPFRLEEGELLRVHVFQGKGQAAVVVAIHHILADHQAVDVLTAELSTLYDGEASELQPPPNLVSTYEQQRTSLDARRPALEQFWRSCLDDLPVAGPLPLAGTHSVAGDGKGALIRAPARAGLAEQCRDAAAREGVSLYQWFLAAWTVLLGRYYDRDDIHLATMFSTRVGAQQQAALGCFQNVLIVRPDLEAAATFRDVLEETRSVVGNAIAHGGLPLDEVARLAPARAGGGQLFSTLFTLVSTAPQPSLLSREVLEVEELDYAGTAFDLTFFVITSDEGLTFAVEFNTGVYDGAELAAIFDHYQALLASLAADVDTDWRRCSLIGDKGLEELRADWQRITTAPASTGQLHDAFYRHAESEPDATALRWDTDGDQREISYGELAARADAIAGYIDSVTGDDDTTVAVIGSWRPEMIAAMIGALRSGRSYLPVDVNYPPSRIEHILADAGRPLVLLQDGLQAPDGCVDRCHSLSDALSSGLTPATNAAGDIAYVVYTSGSSGKPKGVRVSHGAAVYSTAERSEVYSNWPPETFLLLSSFAFDSAVAGLWWTLSTGGCLRLVDRQTARAADAVAELIHRDGITHTLCLPGQWSDICRISEQPLDSMKLVIVAGEACTATTIRNHYGRAASAALFNEYGPTEMAVWSTVHPLEQGAGEPVPIGRPLSLTQALVADTYGNPVPRGLSGELVLAGHGIAEGYVGMANGGFVSHPLDEDGRAYRTGDRVRVGSDGLLYYLGRIDEQVKHRGYRIGIESIEQSLSASGPEVAVIPWDGRSLEDLLAALPEDQAHALVDKYLTGRA